MLKNKNNNISICLYEVKQCALSALQFFVHLLFDEWIVSILTTEVWNLSWTIKNLLNQTELEVGKSLVFCPFAVCVVEGPKTVIYDIIISNEFLCERGLLKRIEYCT